jgi:hypothetical protein
MESFSERYGIKTKIIGPQDMPKGVRNRLWNSLDENLFRGYSNYSGERNKLIKNIWCNFFKKELSKLKGQTSYY